MYIPGANCFTVYRETRDDVAFDILGSISVNTITIVSKSCSERDTITESNPTACTLILITCNQYTIQFNPIPLKVALLARPQ
jgi:hypothetical protein